MKDCISAAPDKAPATVNKRVAYAFGMVLGVDDFVQEQTHFEWKSRLANHLTEGYGVLCGIPLTQAPAGEDVEIKLGPGYAISPRGHWLWVEKELCARLGEWIQKNPAPEGTDFTNPVQVYVRLCYRECPTDSVPIAANACASAEDSQAPSRILETVSAGFSWTAPDQSDQAHIRTFARLLAAVVVKSAPVPDDTAKFLQAVKDLKTNVPDSVYHLPEATLRATLQEGLRLWATEVRPTIHSEGCLPDEEKEDCLLIGKLELTWDAVAQKIKSGSVAIHPEEEPVLLDNKVLQEWLAALQATTVKYTDEAQGDVVGKFFDLTVVGLQKRPVAATAPTGGQTLAWSGTQWAPTTAAGDAVGAYTALQVQKIQGVSVPAGVPGNGQILVGNNGQWTLGDHGNLLGLGDDDHPQYLLASGTRPLTGNWGVGNKKITGLAKPTANGDAVRLDEAVLDGDPAGGDLSGSYPNPTVARLLGRPLATAPAPATGQALVWNGNAWVPQTIVAPAPPLDMEAILKELLGIPVLELANLSVAPATTQPARPERIRMWFHLAPGEDNTWRLEKLERTVRPLRIFAELPNSPGVPPFLQEIVEFNLVEEERNVWSIPTRVLNQADGPTLFRFVFDLSLIQARIENDPTSTPTPLLQRVQDNKVRWEGFDGERTVTLFFERPAKIG